MTAFANVLGEQQRNFDDDVTVPLNFWMREMKM